MKEFLEYLIKSIVSKPEEAFVTETQDGEYFIYVISVAQEDMGTVIGRQGNNIRGLRNMAKAKAIKEGIRIRVELEDKQKPEDAAAAETPTEATETAMETEVATESAEEAGTSPVDADVAEDAAI